MTMKRTAAEIFRFYVSFRHLLNLYEAGKLRIEWNKIIE